MFDRMGDAQRQAVKLILILTTIAILFFCGLAVFTMFGRMFGWW